MPPITGGYAQCAQDFMDGTTVVHGESCCYINQGLSWRYVSRCVASSGYKGAQGYSNAGRSACYQWRVRNACAVRVAGGLDGATGSGPPSPIPHRRRH